MKTAASEHGLQGARATRIDDEIARRGIKLHGRVERVALAIVLSFALQHGAAIDAIRRALCRDSQGRALGPLGAALDLLAKSANHG